MKAVVAVQKKLLLSIYYLWKTNEPFDKNYSKKQKNNIQEEELELSSELGSVRAKRSSQAKSLATQGKHPMSNHRMFPLDDDKSKELISKS